MDITKNKILQPGFEVKVSPKIFRLSKTDWEKMKEISRILQTLGEEIFNAYKNNDSEIVKFVEFGLPTPLLELMRRSKENKKDVIKTYPLRFDFYISKDGPKLIEIANNPWGLMAYKNQHTAYDKQDIADFPAEKFYSSIFETLNKNPKHLGIWKHFNTCYEVNEIEKLAQKMNIEISYIDNENLDTISSCDAGLLIDLDTAWMGKNFPDRLIDFQKFFLPPMATEIFKHKSFLAMAYAIANKKVHFKTLLSEKDIEPIIESLVPVELCEKKDSSLINFEINGAAIKEVVGMWGQQVTILPPKNILSVEKNKYKKFHKHFNRAIKNKNAIIQKYIHPIHFEDKPTLFSEISAIFFDENFYPFARTYSDLGRLAEPETGSSLVQIY